MEWLDFFYAALVIGAGSVIQTLTGMGTGFLVVPIIALIDISLLPGPMVLASMSLSGLMTYRGRAHIDYKNVGAILCGIVPGAIIGDEGARARDHPCILYSARIVSHWIATIDLVKPGFHRALGYSGRQFLALIRCQDAFQIAP